MLAALRRYRLFSIMQEKNCNRRPNYAMFASACTSCAMHHDAPAQTDSPLLISISPLCGNSKGGKSDASTGAVDAFLRGLREIPRSPLCGIRVLIGGKAATLMPHPPVLDPQGGRRSNRPIRPKNALGVPKPVSFCCAHPATPY